MFVNIILLQLFLFSFHLIYLCYSIFFCFKCCFLFSFKALKVILLLIFFYFLFSYILLLVFAFQFASQFFLLLIFFPFHIFLLLLTFSQLISFFKCCVNCFGVFFTVCFSHLFCWPRSFDLY